MSSEEARGYCRVCKANGMIRRQQKEHLAHFVLTLFTFGLWLPIWGLASLSHRPWRCVRCGSKCRRSIFS